MKVVGVTGGIGAGKSMVCSVFATLGVPIFNADLEAKKLYDDHPELLISLREIFGNEIFKNGILDKKRLAELVFSDGLKLEHLNQLVHPLVAQSFLAWKKKQRAPYIIREAAILIESKTFEDCDHIILISAPESLKIQRTMQRSGLCSDQVKSRMKEQLTDEQRRPFCDFEVLNDEQQMILPMISFIHQQLMV